MDIGEIQNYILLALAVIAVATVTKFAGNFF